MTITETAEAFFGHRFAEAYPRLSPDVRWVLPGQATIEGRDAVIAACENTAAELATATTEFTRFRTITGPDAVAVDVIARYVDAAGDTSVVSSCDIYEFDGDTLVTVTSYTVGLAG